MTTWNAAPMPELGLELVRDVDRERIRSRLPRWDPRLWGDAQFSKNTRPGNRLLQLGLAWGRERVKARELQQENAAPLGEAAPVSRFTGKEEDVEVGLQYFGKRYLSPYLGRWISADPLAVHVPGEADLNLYAYVHGAVLRSIDPLGLCEPGAGGACSDNSVAGTDTQRNTPRQKDPYEAEFQAGERVGTEHGEFRAWVEHLTGQLGMDRGGVSVLDRLSDGEKTGLAKKIESARASLPKLTQYETAEQQDAAERGFQSGSGSGYSQAKSVNDAARDLGNLLIAAVGSKAIVAERAMQLQRSSVSIKLRTYLLNSEHPRGAAKAKWFKEALGFTQENADDLGKQLVFDAKQAFVTRVDKFGTHFNQMHKIEGANGRVIDVTFGWTKGTDGAVRLTTGIPAKK